MFALEIDNENGVRQAFHMADAAEVFDEARLLAAEAGLFLFDVAGDAAVCFHRLDVVELLEGLLDGFEIGERAAEPTLGDARLAGSFGNVADGRLRLFFGADKQHLAAAAHLGGHKIAGDVEQFECFIEVNDVDAVLRPENIGLHSGVPTPCLVSEMDARLE